MTEDFAYPEENIEQRLKSALRSDIPNVKEAIGHLIDAGGKRIRPRFAVLLGRILGDSKGLSETVGVAAELVHTATLLHDDVLDESDERRGRPTVHNRYGTKAAILGGDFLLARALVTLTDRGLFHATHDLTTVMSEIVEAEVLQNSLRFQSAIAIDDVKRIAEGKTGALFRWCGQAVAGALDHSSEYAATVTEMSGDIGFAFQVADDLLDFRQEQASSGKPQHRDLREGQITLPVQIAREKNTSLSSAIDHAFNTRSEAAFDEAYEILAASTAERDGLEVLRECREGVLAQARMLDVDAAALERIQDFVDWVIHRTA